MKVVITGPHAPVLLSERASFLLSIKDAGHAVTVICPQIDDASRQAFSAMGIDAVAFATPQKPTSFFSHVSTILSLGRAVRTINPDVMINCTVQQVILGSFAGFLARVNSQYALISDAHIFCRRTGRKQRLFSRIQARLCRMALSMNRLAIFYDAGAKTIFSHRHILPPSMSTCLISGTGVDLDGYPKTPLPDAATGIEFLCLAGLARDSGMEEIAEAARLVRLEYPNCRFRLIGAPAEGEGAISESDLSLWKAWMEIAYTEQDIRADITRASVFILPACNEGIPHSALAAMSMGRPIIAIDAPGCRETVLSGINGYLVPPRTAKALADAMTLCIQRPESLSAMGDASRRYAEERFSAHTVNRTLLKEMHLAHALPEAILPQTLLATKIKRAFDLAVAIPAAILLLPLMLFLAWKVRSSISKDIFFRQVRPGKDGTLFRILKFKTMSDAQGPDGALLPDDERLTPLGKKLRAASLDELPELWNVITGDMSLVGPRPLLPQYLERYSARQARRHEIRPGITGWAQINGRNATSWQERFEQDIWYVDNHTVWLDLCILFRTVWKVFKKEDISKPGHATCPEFMGNDEPCHCPSESASPTDTETL